MNRTVAFVLGAPGVGKTTLVRHLLGAHQTIGRWSCGARYCALGPYDGAANDGADRLPNTRPVLVRAFERLEHDVPQGLIALLDGVRFSGADAAWFERRARRVGVLLTASVATIHQRRARRRSPRMSDAWVTEQAGRAERLARDLGRFTEIDTETSPGRVLAAFSHAIRMAA